MNTAILNLLTEVDDLALWQVVLDTILSDVRKVIGMVVEVGRCSHWLRPHQTRWTADGGFAWPTGYGGTAYSRSGLPLFDWSVELEWNGEQWQLASLSSAIPSVRVTVPARTNRHQQAAVHTLWMKGHAERRFYGFRKKSNRWQLTAVSEPQDDQTRDQRKRRVATIERQKTRDQQRHEKAEPRDFVAIQEKPP